MKRAVKLTSKKTIEIKPIPPFAFDPTMHKPDRFPSQDTDWVKGCRWQTMRQKIYSKLFFNRNPENPVSEKKLLQFFDKRFGEYKMLVVHYIWEDLWWRRKHEPLPWLEELIRL